MGGYVRSGHMKAGVGAKGGKDSGSAQKPHTGFLTTSESNNVKGPRPDEKHIARKSGVPRGHDFEGEMKETFKGGGFANIKDKAMPQKNPTTASEGISNRHGSVVPRAEHHSAPGGDAHVFKPPSASNAHGFGHPVNLRRGPLRLSGHSGAHRIGSRSK